MRAAARAARALRLAPEALEARGRRRRRRPAPPRARARRGTPTRRCRAAGRRGSSRPPSGRRSVPSPPPGLSLPRRAVRSSPVDQRVDVRVREADVGVASGPGASAPAARSAQSWQLSSSESSIQASGRSPAYSSSASSFQCAVPNRARPPKVSTGRSAGEPEEQRQVVVGALLPAGRPDELEVLGQAQEARPGVVGDAVRDAVDQVEAAGDLVERSVEAEQADHAVDVDGQDRALADGCHGYSGQGTRLTLRYHHAPCRRTNQLIRKGRKSPAEEGHDARPQVRPGPQAPDRRPAAARRLHARRTRPRRRSRTRRFARSPACG